MAAGKAVDLEPNATSEPALSTGREADPSPALSTGREADPSPAPSTGGRALVAPMPSALTIAIYNVFYWPYLMGSCAVLFVPAIAIWLATFAWDKHLRVLHRYTSWWGAHYLTWAPLVRCVVEGREQLERDKAYVFVSNHQSMVDILAVFATRLPYKWVSKVENFYVPFIGWTMALNRYVPLRRKHLPSILTMFRASMGWLQRGVSVFVFPEGTRSPDRTIQSFHRGAFALACRTGAPVVPVMIEGTGEILGKGSFRIVPRPVTIRVLAPIDPRAAGFDSRRLRDIVRARMIEEQHRLRGLPQASPSRSSCPSTS